MTLFEAAAEIAAFLEERRIEYVILGGLAVQQWGEPRATHDVDVTVMVPQERLEQFAQEILQRFRPRLPDALGFALRHRVLLVESASEPGEGSPDGPSFLCSRKPASVRNL